MMTAAAMSTDMVSLTVMRPSPFASHCEKVQSVLVPVAFSMIRDASLAVMRRSPVASPQMSGRVQSSLDSMRDSLREAAAQTGGEAFIHWSELSEALVEIEDDTSRFYLLAYEPPSPEDGEYHEISIEVSEAALRRHELTFDEVARAVRRSSLDLPGGSVKTEGGEILSRYTPGEIDAAMKAGDKDRLKVVRLIMAAIKQTEVDQRIEVDDAGVLATITKMVKQRRESISQFEKANATLATIPM